MYKDSYNNAMKCVDGDGNFSAVSSRPGYTFDAWRVGSVNGDKVLANNTNNLSAGTTIYESWTPNTYTVNYNLNLPSGATESSGSQTMVNQTFTYDSLPTLTANTYKVDGYDFLGWSTNSGDTEAVFLDGAQIDDNFIGSANLAKNNVTIKLYAIWEKQGMDITYHKNDGNEPEETTTQKIYLDRDDQTLNANPFIYENKAFDSWNTQADGEGEVSYKNRAAVSFEEAGRMDLYAQWVPAGVKVTKNETDNYFKDINEALAENPDATSMTFTLLADDESKPENAIIPANVTINLDGHTWKPGGDVTNQGIIKNGTVDGVVGSEETQTVSKLTNRGNMQNVTLSNVEVKQGDSVSDPSMGTLDGGVVSETASVWYGTVKGSVANYGHIVGAKVDEATITGEAPEFIVQFSANTKTFSNTNAAALFKDQIVEKGGFVTEPIDEPTADNVLFVQWDKASTQSTEWEFDTEPVTANTTIYAIWEEHSHTWKYDAENGTIYAWCGGNPRCTYHADSIDGAKTLSEVVSLTMTAKDATYDGVAYEDSNVTYKDADKSPVEDGKFPETGEAIGAVTYYLADGGTKTGADDEASSGAATEGGAPKNVGTYQASITVDGKTAMTSFTIGKKSLAAQSVSVALSGGDIAGDAQSGYYYVWDGSFKEPIITVKDNETGDDVELVRGKDYTVSGTASECGYGDYTITLTGKGNYKDKVKVKWSIKKKILSPTVTLSDWTYGDAAETPEISGAGNAGTPVYTYYTDETCQTKTTTAHGAGEAGGVPSFAGEYWVKADLAETANYEAASATDSFTISPKDITVTPKDGQKKTYGDLDPELTFTADLVGDDTLSGSLDRAPGEDKGTYAITQGTVDNAHNPNYAITFTIGKEFTIEAKSLTEDMVSVSPVNYTYTGSECEPTKVFHDNTTKVSGTGITESDLTFKGSTASSDYGVYNIYFVGQGNYTGMVKKQWCISPVKDAEFTYTGESYSIDYTKVDGLDLKFKDTDGAYTLLEAPKKTKPGVYRFDYQMNIDGEEVNGYVLLTIKKIAFSATVNIAESFGYGETINPSLADYPGDGAVTYYYKKSDALDTSYTREKPVEVGRYTVKAVVLTTDYYEGGVATKEFAITSGTLAVKNPKKQLFGCKDTGAKSVSLDESYVGLEGVSYVVGSVTDEKGILQAESVSVTDGVVNFTLTGACTVDAEATIPVTVKSTNYSDVTLTVTIGVDSSVPVIDGVTDGATYCETQTITVSDNNLSKVMINDEEVPLSENGTYSLLAADKTYVVKATDKAGNSKTVTVKVNNGHTWKNDANHLTFSWTGYTGATASFTCGVDANHTEEKACTITSETTLAPTCTEPGTKVYTASVTLDGKTYTDTKTETLAAKGHTEVVDAAVAPTCTETGLTEGKHCSVCEKVLVEQTVVEALGHDWTGEWETVKEATATENGKKVKTCMREECNQKRYDVIPAEGTEEPENPDNPNAGHLEKDAEITPGAPIEEATLNNKKSELLTAEGIFTQEEKTEMEGGKDARVWLEISKTDEDSLNQADREKIIEAAKTIMGDEPDIVYFDADLFKQVEGGDKEQIHEPETKIGITIRISDELINHDSAISREYKVIRLHVDAVAGESLVDLIDGEFNSTTNEFTFMTDKFSTYAIVYRDKKSVTGVTLNQSEVTLTKAGQTLQLVANIAPEDATDKNVSWTSHNTNVATVDANGLVTAVANGTCKITATTEDGNKTAACSVTVKIPQTPSPGNNGGGNNQNGKPATPQTPSSGAMTAVEETTPEDVLQANELALNAGLKVSQKGKKLSVSWGKVPGADGYDVYVQYCNKEYNEKSLNSVTDGNKNKLTVTEVDGKKLDVKKEYKVYVEAYKMVNDKKVSLGKSITAHIVGSKNAKYTNPKSVKVKKKSYKLKVGKTAKIKASVKLVSSKKKQLSGKHEKQFRYATSDPNVATVSAKGKIKAVGKGSCIIYVYARNGYAKKVKVTVK